jgi:integrase
MPVPGPGTPSPRPARATCGTSTPTLLLSGVPVHIVAARLGHADPAITLRVYAHVIRTAEAAATDIFA